MTSEELAKFDGPDDETVDDRELFWRRIYPGWIVPDPVVHSRLSSQAYKEIRKPEPSPCSLIRAIESSIEQVQKDPKYAMGLISARTIRSRGFKLVRFEDPDEPGHYHMAGTNDRSKQSRLSRLELAGATKHVAGPRWGKGHSLRQS
jgi:hypothetical protein